MGMDLEWLPQPQPELLPKPRRKRIFRRIGGGIARRVTQTYRYDTALWRTAFAGPWIIQVLAFTAAVLGIPTGLGTAADIILSAGAATLVLAVSANLIAVLLAVFGLPIPRLFAGSFVSAFGSALFILHYADVQLDAAAAIAGGAAILGALLGLALGLLRRRHFVSGALLAAALMVLPLALPAAPEVAAPDIQRTAAPAAAITADNPGQPGSYTWRTFTYGSGKDLQREGYGDGAELISTSVDASAYIKNWPKLKTLFWGFDNTSLPLNARVWMPKGDGPFPLILMVHGNHMMEDFSEEGYAYLGEQLASRGFIAVTLDENFLNYSAWSGIPDNDFKVRTWMILKHLQQIGTFAEQAGNPFYQKVDYAHTALLGHSRGGQAVAMAADAGRWFKDDPAMSALEQFHIRSVIALAPTDKAIDDTQAKLTDINYLTLQGARDGDVHDFYGDRQYIRAAYTLDSGAFKSSLYIEDANHSQFNTNWGLYDQSFPVGLLLDRSRIMDGTDQREIAKVYVSAFLEATLHGNGDYVQLFRDYRSGAAWLPQDTAYYSRYQDGNFIPLAVYDEDRKPDTSAGGTISASGLIRTEEVAKDREAKSKTNYGVVLTRSAAAGTDAFYSITLKDDVTSGMAAKGAEGLAFSLSNRNADRKADSDASAASPAVEVELTDAHQVTARLPLSEVLDILPLPRTRFTLYPWLEERIAGGKYGDPSEAVYQTYRLPFARFQAEEPQLDAGHIVKVTFYLQGQGDKIMLDDIGFYTR